MPFVTDQNQSDEDRAMLDFVRGCEITGLSRNALGRVQLFLRTPEGESRRLFLEAEIRDKMETEGGEQVLRVRARISLSGTNG